MSYPYRQKCKEVKERFELGLLNEHEAMEKLGEIEETAYDKIPYAEPDGDITYCVAMTVEEIRNS